MILLSIRRRTTIVAIVKVAPDTKTLISQLLGGWKELARTTLGVAGDNIAVSSLANKRYYMMLYHGLDIGGTISSNPRLNSDAANNYGSRQSQNGGADTTQINSAQMRLLDTDASDQFGVAHFANRATEEKLMIGHGVMQDAIGSGTAPQRFENTSKWVNTTDAIDTITSFNAGTGDYAIDSEVVVLGWDPNDTHADNFWEELASVPLGAPGDNLSSGTFTAKKYLWVQVYCKATGGAITGDMTYNNDTATNYARRFANNGVEQTPQDTRAALFAFGGSAAAIPFYANIFIINRSANEKLNIGHEVSVNVAGPGTAPNRVEHAGKWANTSAQITEIDIDNAGAGSYDVGSIIKVWGAN